MTKQKIVLNMIVRNCAGFIENALNSTLGHIDYYVIGFGGESSDSTENIVKQWLSSKVGNGGYVTLSIKWKDDFGDARRQVLAATEKEFPNSDWLFWMDSDDVLDAEINLHELVDKFGRNFGVIQMPYLYQQDENGRNMVWHLRERLVRLSLGWTWMRPVHETLTTTAPHEIVFTDDAKIIHDDTHVTNRNERNREILFRWLEEKPEDLRTKLYIGHSFYSNQEWEQALKWFGEYFFQPENPLEQWSAATFAGRSCIALEQWEEATGWFYHSLDIEPKWIDSYIGLGMCHTRMGNYEQAVEFFKTADTKERPPALLFIIENEYTWNRYCYEHEAYAQMGDIESADKVCGKALDINPQHDGFRYYRFGYREALSLQKDKASIEHLVDTLVRRGDGLTALDLLKNVPAPLEEDPHIDALRLFVKQSIAHLWDNEERTYLYQQGNSIAGETSFSTKRILERIKNTSRIQPIDEAIGKYAKEAKEAGKKLRVVDLACAGGGIGLYLAQKYDLYLTGIDMDEASIKEARKRAKELGLEEQTKFIYSSIEKLDINEVGRHDVALALEIIEHTDMPEFFIGTCIDLADRVLISCPRQLVIPEIGGQPRSQKTGIPLHGHVREYSRADLERLGVQSGCSIENLWTNWEEEYPIPGYGNWIMELNSVKRVGLPVVFYVGRSGAEDWTPHQIDKEGLGGSETAAIKMAKQFADHGYPTFVYGPIDGIYDGVIYRKAEKFNPTGPASNNPAWLFIASRIPDAFDGEINAVHKMLWCHDNTFSIPQPTGQVINRLSKERADNIDTILVLSNWAKQYLLEQYPYLDEEKLVVTHNGITVENFEGLARKKKVSHSFIWASSIDRGLDRALDQWPAIKEMWPDATLDIFYGIHVMQQLYGHVPHVQKFMQEILGQADALEGVEFRDRIGQKELAKEFAKHQFWFYPTDFGETFCIVAEEAQAAGCIPITTSVGALEDRVPDEFRIDWEDGSEFVAKLKHTDERYKKLPKKYVDVALSYTWEKVFTQWETIGKEALEVRQNEHPS